MLPCMAEAPGIEALAESITERGLTQVAAVGPEADRVVPWPTVCAEPHLQLGVADAKAIEHVTTNVRPEQLLDGRGLVAHARLEFQLTAAAAWGISQVEGLHADHLH